MTYAGFFGSYEHILPYIVLLAAYIALSFASDLFKNRLFHLSAIALLIIFAGFRDIMNPDMDRYRLLYESSGTLSYSNFLEPSFVYISKLLHVSGFSYHAMFLVYSCITISFVYCGIKNFTGYIKTSLLFYILTPGLFLSSFIAIRESCAISMAFYATSLLFRDSVPLRGIKVTFFALGSCLFHYSAIAYWVICWPTYKLRKRAIPWQMYVGSVIVSALIPTTFYMTAIYYTIYPLLGSKYQFFVSEFMYADVARQTSNHLATNAYYMLIVIWVLLRRRSLSALYESYNGLLLLLVIGIVILNATKSFFEIQRIASYFLVYIIVLMPLLLSSIEVRRFRTLCSYCVFLLYLTNFVLGLYMFTEETQSYTFLHYRNVILDSMRLTKP